MQSGVEIVRWLLIAASMAFMVGVGIVKLIVTMVEGASKTAGDAAYLSLGEETIQP